MDNTAGKIAAVSLWIICLCQVSGCVYQMAQTEALRDIRSAIYLK